MGQAFGHINSGATMADDSGKSVSDPNLGLSDGQLMARKLVAGGLAGLGGKTLAQVGNYPAPTMNPAQPITVNQGPLQPPVPNVSPQGPDQDFWKKLFGMG
jgi:hypothetical protein